MRILSFSLSLLIPIFFSSNSLGQPDPILPAQLRAAVQPRKGDAAKGQDVCQRPRHPLHGNVRNIPGSSPGMIHADIIILFYIFKK